MSWLVSLNLPIAEMVEKETFGEAMEYARELSEGFSEVVVSSKGEKFSAVYILRKLWD